MQPRRDEYQEQWILCERYYDERKLDGKYNVVNKSLILRDHDWKEVLEYRDWSVLKFFSLRWCIIDSDVEFLGRLRWPNLNHLTLSSDKITKNGIKLLTKINFPKLKQLSLTGIRINDECMDVLLEAQSFPFLEDISISFSRITPAGLAKLPNADWSRMKKLSLSENRIGNAGIKLLVKAELPRLQSLQLIGCQLEQEAAKHLSKAQWPKLDALCIYKNSINLDGCFALTTSSWGKLTYIFLLWPFEIYGSYAGVLSLMAAEWPILQKLTVYFQRKLISQVVSDILSTRFNPKFIKNNKI